MKTLVITILMVTSLMANMPEEGNKPETLEAYYNKNCNSKELQTANRELCSLMANKLAKLG